MGFTSTSITAAEYEYVGEGPTPPPLYKAGDFGGVYEPTVPIVPKRASARQIASAKLTPLSSAVESKTRLSAKRNLSLGTSSFSATASASSALPRSAASIAAFPAIRVTRLEYEP